ncbi:serine/threonine protein phosphatase [mine drainage metagenome]|uniref:Serine/threonine protein phosphatase n=1 Tax=mine drainage metagenome TaxID=410659 RepID=T1BZS1_9ZZZZ
MQLDNAMMSIKGKMRERDEDAICLITSSLESEIDRQGEFFCALADGMGGMERGELASKLSISEARHIGTSMLSKDLSPAEIVNAIKRIFQNANEALISYAGRNGNAKMGTTLVVAYSNGTELYVGNVGDSRLYIFNGGKRSFRTADHSYVQMLTDQGIITEEEAKIHPRKNEMTRAIGLEDDPTPDIYRLRLFRGDSILLCCDGLWEAYDDKIMATTLMSNMSCRDSLESMILRANEVDGSDNISGILIGPVVETTEEGALKRPTKPIASE